MFEYVLNSPVVSEDRAELMPGDADYCWQPVTFQYESMAITNDMIKPGYPWCTVTLPSGTTAGGHDLSGLSFLMQQPRHEHASGEPIACEVPVEKTYRASGKSEPLTIKMFTCNEHGQMMNTVEVPSGTLASAMRQRFSQAQARERSPRGLVSSKADKMFSQAQAAARTRNPVSTIAAAGQGATSRSRNIS